MTRRRRLLALAVPVAVAFAFVAWWAAQRDDGGQSAAPPATAVTTAPSRPPTSILGATVASVAPTSTTPTTPPEVSVPIAPAPPVAMTGVAPRTDEPIPLRPLRACEGGGEPTTGTIPGPSPQGGRQWVSVGALAGRCDGQSATFALSGVDTRLVVRSDAAEIAVFLVDAVEGEDASAGFAEITCSGPCAETLPLVNAAGRYSLRVQGGDAPWTVTVQEYRRP